MLIAAVAGKILTSSFRRDTICEWS